jgi:hypothetical protein
MKKRRRGIEDLPGANWLHVSIGRKVQSPFSQKKTKCAEEMIADDHFLAVLEQDVSPVLDVPRVFALLRRVNAMPLMQHNRGNPKEAA